MKLKLRSYLSFALLTTTLIAMHSNQVETQTNELRPRVREVGIKVGVLPAGPLNAITDVGGIKVGHCTIIRGEDIRTGVTAILPYDGNLFQEKVRAKLI